MKTPKVERPKHWPKTNILHNLLKDIAPLLFWKPTVEIKGKDLKPSSKK